MIDGLDPVIHAPKRLAAMAVLANATTVTFRFLKDYLEVTDSDLSKHMSALENAGYVATTKTGHGRGATTTYRMTKAGEHAYTTHRNALRTLLDGPK
ncbi:transcriptional regulator [Kribbella sp. NBC_00482]|uniref:transcriptional regulator n=1 Tax=Kribbella sp. NBC_00482 TaxID=2975968 RepID=UPI002E1755A2